ncbi:GDP dissociation inhibitor family protein [Cryptosporidium serpentis]
MNRDKWDVLVVGTGILECIVAAGLSCRGFSVLHIDPASSYGTYWNTIKLDNLNKWLTSNCDLDDHIFDTSPFSNKFGWVNLSHSNSNYSLNKFCIDLLPKVIFSRSPLVDILLSCKITHYLEFQGVNYLSFCNIDDDFEDMFTTKTLSRDEVFEEGSLHTKYISPNPNKFINIPFSKKTIFASTDLTLYEKRSLMKLFKGMSHLLDSSAEKQKKDLDIRNDPFRSPAVLANSIENINELDLDLTVNSWSLFQKKWKLTNKTLDMVRFCIALNFDTETNINWQTDVTNPIGKLIRSLNQHGCSGTPFLFPCYGVCDIPQAFSRFAAVNGAVYRLHTYIENIKKYNDGWEVEIRNYEIEKAETLKSKLLIGSPRLLSHIYDGPKQENIRQIFRMFVITCKPLIVQEETFQEDIFFASVKINQTKNLIDNQVEVVNIMQCGSRSGCCPKGSYIINICKIMSKAESAEEVTMKFERLLKYFFNNSNEVEDNYIDSIIYKGGYIYNREFQDPIFTNDGIIYTADPFIDFSSFFILDGDIQNAMTILQYALNYLQLDNKEILTPITFKKEKLIETLSIKEQCNDMIFQRFKEIFE